MARCWRGQESGGISIALVAKHKRKDQLIDKILIRAFDSYDRSVKAAAAPSPSSTFTLLKLTCVSLYQLPSRSLRPLRLLFLVIWKMVENDTRTVLFCCVSIPLWNPRCTRVQFGGREPQIFISIRKNFRHISAARRSSRLPPRPYASRTHTTRYLHHNTLCFFLLSALDLSDRWPFAMKQFHRPFVSCGCLRWWAAEIMDFSGWCTLLNSVMAGLQKCMSYCCEALGSANPD